MMVGFAFLLLGAGAGVVLQRSHFCTMGCISDAVLFGSLRRLRVWALALAVAMLGSQVLDALGVVDLGASAYRSEGWLFLGAVPGGLLFGFGMVLADAGGEVAMWAREPEVVEDINHRHHNDAYHEGIELPPSMWASQEVGQVLQGAQIVVLAIPSQTLRDNLQAWKEMIPADATLVSLMKGIELGTVMRMSQVIAEVTGFPESQVAVVSGPNLAREVAQRIEPEIVQAMGVMGFLGPELPEQFGGLGTDCVTSGLLLEQIAYGDFNVAYVNLLTSLCGHVIAQHAAPAQPVAERLGRAAGRVHEEEDHVARRPLRLDLKPEPADVGKPAGEAPRVGVVVGKPGDMMVEGMDARRREQSRLAHAAAELLAESPGALNEVLRSDERTAHRGAEPLREADREGVDMPRELRCGHA